MRSRILFGLVLLLIPVAAFATHVPGPSQVITYDGPLAPGVAATGVIGWGDPIDGYDWYCMNVTTGTKVTLTVTKTSGDLHPDVGLMRGLADTGGTATLPIVGDTSNSTEDTATLEVTPDFTGPATVWISTFLNEKQGGYSVTMTGGTARSGCSATVIGPSGPLLQVIPPEDTTVNNSASITLPVTIYRASTFNSEVALNVTGLPDDVTWKLTPAVLPAPGYGKSQLTITTGAVTTPGFYTTQITATGGETTVGSTFTVEIACDPPLILGSNQLTAQTVARGSTAKLTIKPTGSGPFFYQWYNGYPGMTWSPIADATGASYTTPAITDTNPYWVRVTNACGVADSAAAVVSPQ